jgi:hypothetical protein
MEPFIDYCSNLKNAIDINVLSYKNYQLKKLKQISLLNNQNYNDICMNLFNTHITMLDINEEEQSITKESSSKIQDILTSLQELYEQIKLFRQNASTRYKTSTNEILKLIKNYPKLQHIKLDNYYPNLKGLDFLIKFVTNLIIQYKNIPILEWYKKFIENIDENGSIKDIYPEDFLSSLEKIGIKLTTDEDENETIDKTNESINNIDELDNNTKCSFKSLNYSINNFNITHKDVLKMLDEMLYIDKIINTLKKISDSKLGEIEGNKESEVDTNTLKRISFFSKFLQVYQKIITSGFHYQNLFYHTLDNLIDDFQSTNWSE